MQVLIFDIRLIISVIEFQKSNNKKDGKHMHQQLRKVLNYRNRWLQERTKIKRDFRKELLHRLNYRYTKIKTGNFRQHKSDSLLVITETTGIDHCEPLR